MILDSELLGDGKFKEGDLFREVDVHSEFHPDAGKPYVGSVTWEILRIDPRGFFVQIKPGQGITPHRQWVSPKRRVIRVNR